jgi:hypothetical protein
VSLPVVGCNSLTRRKSQLDGVRRAELKIESRIATGVNRVEYPQVLSELAYELLLAKDLTLDAWDSQAAKKYGEALETYMAAKDVGEASQEYRECMKEIHYTVNYCHNMHEDSIKAAASKAHVNVSVVEGADAVQVVWQMAEQQVQQAEKMRLGQLPEKNSTLQNKN